MSKTTGKKIERDQRAEPKGAVTLSERQLEQLPAGGTHSDPEWKYVPVRRFSS